MPQSRSRTEAAIAAVLVVVSAPLWLAIAIGIKLSNPGPIFFIADRAGLHGKPFRLMKFRTMRIASGPQSRISAANDSRVFPFGAILRTLKLDELPQLINIARGEMAFVGPRPEDPWFVENHYTPADRETLSVLPGLTSPGTLYYVTEAESAIDPTATESSYVSGPLQRKLALDRAYIATASPLSDMRVIAKTVLVLLGFAR